MSTPSILTIIPAKDEEIHIERCVASARPLGDVIVVDGGSGDATVRLARGAGATVLERPWRGYSDQKNWALDQVEGLADWVLFLDADEYLTDAARAGVRAAVTSDAADGYYLGRRYFFFGRRLDHAYWYPDYQLRLFRAGRGRFESRLVHEHLRVDGVVAESDIDLVHENLKGISDYVGKLNRYADLEAREIVHGRRDADMGSIRGTWAERRRALKAAWLKLPGRAVIRFCWLYFVKRGFLDGRAGLTFCGLIAVHDFLIEAKVAEHRLGYAPEQVRLRVLNAGADQLPVASSRSNSSRS
jgi:glycosyltransferase involved in cell wall biosynthesis